MSVLDSYVAPKTPRMSPRMLGLWRDPVTEPMHRDHYTFHGDGDKHGVAAPFYYVMKKVPSGLPLDDFTPEWERDGKLFEVRRVWLLVDNAGRPNGKGRVADAMRINWYATFEDAKAYLEELFEKKIKRAS